MYSVTSDSNLKARFIRTQVLLSPFEVGSDAFFSMAALNHKSSRKPLIFLSNSIVFTFFLNT